jgi:hypothetical protein
MINIAFNDFLETYISFINCRIKTSKKAGGGANITAQATDFPFAATMYLPT